jgi:hypothetical protein
VEGLRIVPLAEFFDFGRRDGMAGDGVELLADVKVLEVEVLGHAVCFSS